MKALIFTALIRCRGRRPEGLGRALGALLLLAAAVPLGLGPAAAEPLLHGQGVLWRIETQGAPPSYLFGTMHSTDPAVLALPEPVKAAFAESESLTVEMVIDKQVQKRLGQAMVLSNGRSLESIIGPERFAAVAAVGANYGLPAKALKLFKPWAAMSIFSMPPTEFRRNAEGVQPLDQRLQAEAQQRGLPIYGLESVEEQIAVFSEIPEPDQVTLLDLVLQEQPQIEQWFTRIKVAYLGRNVADIYDLMTEQTEGAPTEVAETFEKRLIVDRNRRMAKRMRGVLNQGRAFIAIGALHLPGDQGVVHLLEIEGRRVSRVY